MFGLLDWEEITHQPEWVVDIVSIPIFSAIAGLLTNWTGVIMLFSPVRFSGFYVPGVKTVFAFLPRKLQILPIFAPGGILGFQGFVPARAEKMASIVVDKAIAKIGNVSDFYRELDPDGIAKHVAEIAKVQLRPMVDDVMEKENKQFWQDLPPNMKELVYQRVEQELPSIAQKAFRVIGDNIDQLLDIKLLAVGHMRRNPQIVVDIFHGMGAPELRFMVRSGLLGAPFGVGLALFLIAMPHIPIIEAIPKWIIVLLVAALIGITVNIIAIKVVFTPGDPQPRWKYPWKQAKLAKRQYQAAGDFGHMLAYQVLTLENIANELLYGPRGDKTTGLLQDMMQREITKILGPVTSLVKVAVGAREFSSIQTGAGGAAVEFAPSILQDAEFSKEQSEKIDAFASQKLRELPVDEFMDLLYSAIEQDAWLLYAHGGLLGIVVGAVHLLIFGW
ncbi:hypothetical protein FOS14_10850 [Skermania sp. ID1734]|nr:hypothetical protein [Skermania sp. ID1734]TSD99848.1 hypothetical protein FOS14_10850 [Skermania sp. ID1734]